MKLLWLFCFLPVVFGKASFGTAYFKNSRLCHQWSCVTEKLGLKQDSLPSQDSAKEVFTRILPKGPWQEVLGKVLDTCYNNRTRQYTNTCPGQALLHCVVDQMIDNCPEENFNKDNGCSPISSLAGLKHMFSLSRCDNLEKNLSQERRPKWFLNHYFDRKCCDLPTIFNSSVLQECGFTSFITYYRHNLGSQVTHSPPSSSTPPPARQHSQDMTVQIVSLNQATTSKPLEAVNIDPLDCCDMTEFIEPSWRTKCGFHLTWKGQERLVIANYTPELTTAAPVTTSTRSFNQPKDLMLLPHSCPDETCVFKKLGIIKESGVIDITAYIRMLDNFTNAHPSWDKPSARVVTKCLTRGVHDYEGSCEINKILACTLDVLTENCPYRRNSADLCKHNKRITGCQISSSKMRPKNRRKVCLLPPLIDLHHLSECGLESLYKTEYVVLPEIKPKKHIWSSSRNLCQDQKPSTTCVMKEMGVLNKYQFMDYFRMKDRIRQFTLNQPVWSALLDIYMSAFINIPMYGEHCSSQKKLLNVIDAMVLTCPASKRKDSPQCKQLFKEMTDTSPSANQTFTKQKVEQMMKHYTHIFLQSSRLPPKVDPVIRKPKPKIVKKPIYNYGLLGSQLSPKVTLLDIKPAVITRLDRPLVLAPVYMRDPKLGTPMGMNNLYRGSRPYWLHDKTPRFPFTTPASEISTKTAISTNTESTTLPIPTIPTS